MGASDDHDAITRLTEKVHGYVTSHSREHTTGELELQRRLEVLNHAREEAQRKEGTFLSIDTHNIYVRDQLATADRLTAQIDKVGEAVVALNATTRGEDRVKSLTLVIIASAAAILAVVASLFIGLRNRPTVTNNNTPVTVPATTAGR